MKKNVMIIGGIVLAGIVVALVILGINMMGNRWVKNSNGVWTKIGNPKNTPSSVAVNGEMVQKAKNMLTQAKNRKVDLTNGPCLGHINDDWVADVVHNPRQAIDDNPENQCASLIQKQANHFIEIDEQGEIIKVR